VPPAPLQREGLQATAPAPTEVSQLRGRVLVVDDEEMVLRFMARVLREHDHVCVRRAQDALVMLEAGQRFDIIFSDLMMPTMTGMEFYEVLLGHDPALAKHIVFLSGGVVTENARDFLDSVSNKCIDKPFVVSDLRAVIQEILRQRPAVDPI
jgi:CheY-like chemotaxis protein